MNESVGNADSSVSPYLKAYVKQGNTCVVSLIGEGSSRELSANLGQPVVGVIVAGSAMVIEQTN